MKKILSFVILMLLSIGLMGCSNSTEAKAIEQGKLLLAQSEYDKALGSFELAVSEGTRDEEVKTLINIIEGYNKGSDLIEQGKMDQAKKIVDAIPKEYKNYTIKTDIDVLKEKLDVYKENNQAMEEKLKVIDDLLSQFKYADSKVKTDEIINSEEVLSELHKERLDAQIATIDSELEKLEEERVKKEKSKLETKKKKDALESNKTISVEQAKTIVLGDSDKNEVGVRHEEHLDVVVDGVKYYLLDRYSINGGFAASAMFVSSKDGSVHSTSKFSYLW